jgi:hypothetical protein
MHYEEEEDDDIETIVRSVIPAQPGWFLGLLVDDDKASFDYMEVIAWDIQVEYRKSGPFRVVYPITADCDRYFEHSKNWLLKSPTGILFRPGDQRFRSEQDAIEELAKRQDTK